MIFLGLLAMVLGGLSAVSIVFGLFLMVGTMILPSNRR